MHNVKKTKNNYDLNKTNKQSKEEKNKQREKNKECKINKEKITKNVNEYHFKCILGWLGVSAYLFLLTINHDLIFNKITSSIQYHYNFFTITSIVKCQYNIITKT